MNEVAHAPFVQSLLDTASLAQLPGSGIAWLDEARRENLAAFAAAGLPDARDESWKYTALRALAQRNFLPRDAQASTRTIDSHQAALAQVGGPSLIFVNGYFRAELSSLEHLPVGVSVRPLSQVLEQDGESLRFALARHYRDVSDAFARLNAAFAADGAVLQVAAGIKLQTPIRLVYLGAAAEGDCAWHLRNIIEVGEDAQLNLIEQYVAADENANLGTVVGDVILRERAVLQHAVLQTAAIDSLLVRRSHYRIDTRAQASLHVLELGGALVRHDLQADLAGDGARFTNAGVFLPKGRQHIDTQLSIRHRALQTTSESTWRGVADERGRGVFRGAIEVARGADGSDASLSNKNLLLSALAEIDTKPELEIYADEVKAAHGATVGQLDERALFYLRSRGIPQAEARALLTVAFCRALFDDVMPEASRENFTAQLTAHFAHA